MITFDPTISLGNLVSLGALVVLLIGGWLRVERLLAALDERTKGHADRLETVEARLDSARPFSYTDYR